MIIFSSLLLRMHMLMTSSSCIVCAIFRLIYISVVDLTSNVTGTMPATIFLFILEPNLSILCVSIPMLRPFYSKYKKRMGGSRLQEYPDERTGAGYKKSEFRSGQLSQARKTHAGGPETQLEMNDYRYDGTKHDAVVTTYDDGSGSERKLTTSSYAPGRDAIGVETKWAVTRS